jgi:TonB family protein
MKKNKLARFYLVQCFICLLFLPFLGLGQKIAINEQDATAKQRRIELEPLKLVSTAKTKVNFSLGTIGPSIYVNLNGSGTGANIVNVGDKLIFYLDNNSTVTVQSPKLQTYDVEEITSTYKHTYNLSTADLTTLSQHNLKRLRKYHADGYDDVNISNQIGRQVKNLSAFFVEEMKRNNLLREETAVASAKQQPDSIMAETTPTVVNRAAAFPGGDDVWMNFLSKNIKAPTELKANEQKIVMVQFLVRENGAINELEILKSAGPAFDKEILRVLKRMPYWKPAVENGLPVTSTVIKSITISREDSSVGL